MAGAKRGRRLAVPEGTARCGPPARWSERPCSTSWGLWQAVRVLDLFAGTGPLAWRRFPEGRQLPASSWKRIRRVAEILRRNIAALEYEAPAELWSRTTARPPSRLCRRRAEVFDLLFVDPPYRMLAEVEVALDAARTEPHCLPRVWW